MTSIFFSVSDPRRVSVAAKIAAISLSDRSNASAAVFPVVNAECRVTNDKRSEVFRICALWGIPRIQDVEQYKQDE
jgi:hypothetical protein